MASQETNIRQKLKLYNFISSNYYSKQLRYDSAFVYLKKIRSISKREGFIDMEAFALNNQAIIYQSLGDDEKALDYFNQGLLLFKELDNPIRVALLYNNIGMIYKELYQHEKSLTYLDSSFTIAKNGTSKRMLGVVCTSIGEVHYALNNFNVSTPYLKKGIHILDSIQVSVIDANIVLAKSYRAEKKVDSAIAQAQKSLLKAQKQKAPKSSYQISRLLSSIYAEIGDTEKEALYLKNALTYNDTLSLSSNLNDVEISELKEERLLQQEQLESLKNKDLLYNILYAVGAIILILISILLFRQIKTAKLTRNIHEIQQNLIQSELDRRVNTKKDK